ncbi:hypothetical protein [Paraflavitalea speifideaquila]|nr:hypothetical protein [Paraflavitalea speifideiaquila]
MKLTIDNLLEANICATCGTRYATAKKWAMIALSAPMKGNMCWKVANNG